MRRFLKISAILALVFIILLIVVSFIVKIYFPSEKIKSLVVSKISDAIGRNVIVGSADVSILSGIEIRDIYIGEDKSYGEVPFVRIKRVTLGYSLFELINKKVVLNRVVIEEPEVYIRSRNGKLALSDLIKKPAPEEKPKKPLPVVVLLKKGEVRGTTIVYDADNAKSEIRGIDVDLDGELHPFKGVNAKVSSTDKGIISFSGSEITMSAGLLADARLKLTGTTIFTSVADVLLKDARVELKNRRLAPFDASMKVDIGGDLNAGADVKSGFLKVGSGSRLDISGSLKGLKELKGIDFILKGESDLAEASGIAKEFIPASISGIFGIYKAEVKGDSLNSLTITTETYLKRVKISHNEWTVPVDGIIKLRADNKGNIVLSEAEINSTDAVKIEASAMASGWGKGRMDGRANIRIDNEKALGFLPKKLVEKTGKLNISGVTETDIAVGRNSENGPVKVKLSGGSIMKGFSAGPLTISEQSINFSIVSNDILKGRISADADIKASGVKVQKGEVVVNDKSVDISISASSPDGFKKNVSVNAEIKTKGTDARIGDISIRQEATGTTIAASGDLSAGDIDIEKVEVVLPRILKANIGGELKRWGKELDLKAKVDDINFKDILDKISGPIKRKGPKLELEGKGSLSASIIGVFAGKEKGAVNFFGVSGSINAADFGVTIPDKGIIVKNSQADMDFDLSKAVQWLSGRIKIGSLEKVGILDGPLSATAGFEFLAEGPDLKLKNLSAKVPEKGLSVNIHGDIRDYGRAARPDLDMVLSFNSSKKVDLIKGLSAQGVTTLKAHLTTEKEKELALSGGLSLDHMNMSFKDRAAVRDINGEISLSQKVSLSQGVELVTEDVREEASIPLYDLMRPYVKRRYDVTLASASFDSYEAGPLSMDIYWKNGNLVIDRYDLALFEGGAAGSMRASYRKGGPEYAVYSNVAGVKLDRIFKGKKGKDLEINADLNLKGKGTDIEGDVNVTRIGKDILDRGLLSIDPKESNPQIVDIRRKVNSLGWVPKDVSVWVRHGELNMDITLQRKRFTLLNIVSLEKIPVRRVPVGYLLKKMLKKAEE